MLLRCMISKDMRVDGALTIIHTVMPPLPCPTTCHHMTRSRCFMSMPVMIEAIDSKRAIVPMVDAMNGTILPTSTFVTQIIPHHVELNSCDGLQHMDEKGAGLPISAHTSSC